MTPETPLVIEGARGGFGTASSTTTTSATAAQSTAPAQ
jgi:hypothetical protein